LLNIFVPDALNECLYDGVQSFLWFKSDPACWWVIRLKSKESGDGKTTAG
jgi:hypothetical protein